jgi:hypothetical protein
MLFPPLFVKGIIPDSSKRKAALKLELVDGKRVFYQDASGFPI